MSFPSDGSNPYASFGMSAADSPVDVRGQFLVNTYLHLFGAVAAFTMIETIIFKLFYDEVGQVLVQLNMQFGNWWFLGVLVAFMVVSYVASSWAASGASKGLQYAGLGMYVAAESIIFIPLIWVATTFGGPQILPVAAILTLGTFAALTGIVFLTRKDFSFLGPMLTIASFVALGIILTSIVMGFQLGVVIIGGMVLLMSGYILYETSNILHHYPPEAYVAASLGLFASLATLFWYMIQLVMAFSDD